eukprot:GSChrysophyteH1.ASY1.ANO1.2159.1 assembled CDS
MKKAAKSSKCYVERSDLLDDLIADLGPGSPSTSVVSNGSRSAASARSRKSGNGTRGSPARAGSVSSPGKVGSSSTSLAGSSNADVQARLLLERNRIQRAADKDKMFADLQSSLNDSLDFLDEVDRDLSLVDETRRTKTRRQFEDWNRNVHGKIQQKVLSKVNTISSKGLHEKKLQSYEKFLSITNRKPAIFRDIIIESEYDPLEANRSAIRANFTRLKDPLKIDKQKAESELAMVGLHLQDRTGETDRLTPQLWAKGKIESTPYGMFASMMTPADEKEGAMDGRSSNVVFDDYNYPTGKAAVDREMPNPKPRMRKIYTDPKALVTDPKTGKGYPAEFLEQLNRIGNRD